jgi:hypothetical protein
MDIAIGILALVAILALIVVEIGGALGALFFGRKLPWIWFALAVLQVVTKALSVALYRETDAVRAGVGLAGGLVAAVLALLLQRRFPRVVLAIGGFLAAALIVVQVLGPLLNPFPQWLVIAILVGGGIAGAIWTRTNQAPATIVLSALIGAGVLTDNVVRMLQIDEASRFQVYAVIALIGIGFQVWQERRARKRAPAAQGEAA